MRTLIIHVLATIGTWCCQRAIKLSDRGYINFEVNIPFKQPVIVFHQKKKKRRKSHMPLYFTAAIFAGLAVWAILTLAFSIENSINQITNELKREHRQEMRLRYYTSFVRY